MERSRANNRRVVIKATRWTAVAVIDTKAGPLGSPPSFLAARQGALPSGPTIAAFPQYHYELAGKSLYVDTAT